MVIGIFDDISNVEITLNNLAEAEFPPDQISVVTMSPNFSEVVRDESGQWNGIFNQRLSERLQSLGLSPDEINRYNEAVNSSEMLIIVETDNDAAREILEDQHATDVKLLKDNE